MIKLKCIIVDDEPIALNYLKFFVEKIPELELKGVFTKPIEAISFVQDKEIDLVFLDIQMPKLTGLEMAVMLNKKSMIIFTTAYTEYALEGFNVEAIDYLLKPISFERFEKAAHKAIDYYTLKHQEFAPENKSITKDFMLVKAEGKLVKINYADILMFEGLKEYIKIVLSEGKSIVTLESMKNIEQWMPKSDFIRVHKSFIIATKYITAINGNTLELNKTEVPIGATYKEALLEFLKR